MNIDQHILRALRQEPDAGPPADFARNVAAMAAARQPAAAGVEQWLLRGLSVVFALSALVVAAMQGGDWLATLPALLPSAATATTVNWAAATAACLGLTWVMSRLRQEPL